MTQAALAKTAGIGKLYLSQIETGRRTGSLNTLRALAKALGVENGGIQEGGEVAQAQYPILSS